MKSKFVLSAFSDEAASGLKEQIAALKRNGIKHIEIRNVDGHVIVDYDANVLKEIAKTLNGEGIGLSAIGSPIGKINIDEPFEPHIERFKKTLETADILGAKNIRMFSFFLPKGQDSSKYRDIVIERLTRIIDMSIAASKLCCLENEKDLYGDTGERVLDLLTVFKGKLRTIVDPANYIQTGVNPLDAYNKVESYIEYLHIKDVLAASKQVTPAGYGDGNISAIINKASKLVKDTPMFLTVEPHLSLFDGFANLKDDHSAKGFIYASQTEAFDTAVAALKKILNDGGYKYE